MPLLTAATLALTAAVTATRLAGPGVGLALRRDPVALAHGQWWRLLSPVLVQTDPSTMVVLATFAACAVVGALGERLFSPRRWLALYLLGAVTGHGLGELVQPFQGGTSVAFAAVLGGLAARALPRGTAVPRPVRIEAALAIPAATVDTALGDIHGLPFLAGLALASAWLHRDALGLDHHPDRPPQSGDTMTSSSLTTQFTEPASPSRLERAATALRAHGFIVEILADVAAARTRLKDLIPAGVSVFTASSETLRLSGIEEDLNASGRYCAVKPRTRAMDRATRAADIRRLAAAPDVVVGSVAAVTETGSLLAASASGSQLPAYSGGAGRAIWIVGAQKVVPDFTTALDRVHHHALPLENARAQRVYGRPSAINRLLVLNAEPSPGRATVLLLREAIGY